MDERRPYRSFVSYIDRSREYYAASGYPQPYAWASHREAPFTPFRKPLSECRVGLVTTADIVKREGSSEAKMMMRQLYSHPSEPMPARLFTDDLAWDKNATHTNDVDSFLPLIRLAEYAANGRIGSVSPRFYGVPTDYSQGRTNKKSAPQILKWCREDGLDAVFLSAL